MRSDVRVCEICEEVVADQAIATLFCQDSFDIDEDRATFGRYLSKEHVECGRCAQRDRIEVTRQSIVTLGGVVVAERMSTARDAVVEHGVLAVDFECALEGNEGGSAIVRLPEDRESPRHEFVPGIELRLLETFSMSRRRRRPVG